MHDATLFVYGTLQPGQRYWSEIEHLVLEHQPAELAGFALWHLPEGYPGIAPGPGVVRGTLITWRGHAIEDAWRACDRIEGASSQDASPLYTRRIVRVTHWAPGTPRSELTQTYVYHPSRREHLAAHGAPVPNGDWAALWAR